MNSNTTSDLLCSALDATDAAVTPQQHAAAAVCNRAAARAFMNVAGGEANVRDFSEIAEEHLKCAQGKPPGPRILARRELVQLVNPGTVKNRAVLAPSVNNSSHDMNTLDSSDMLLRQRSAIKDIMALHPRLTYEQARNRCRDMHPELFGISTSTSTAEAARNRGGESLALSAERRAAVSNFMVTNRCSFDTAWQKVKKLRPELFVEADAATARPVTNRAPALDDDTRAAGIREAIYQLKKEKPTWSYGQLRDAVRRAQPALFGLA